MTCQINHGHCCGDIGDTDDIDDTFTIDRYIAENPVEIQPILQKIRESIRAAAPNAQEKISWQMPTFWQGKNRIYFAAFKKHISIFPGYVAEIPFKKRLMTYQTTKSAVHFPYDKPIDYELITDIALWRLSCLEDEL